MKLFSKPTPQQRAAKMREQAAHDLLDCETKAAYYTAMASHLRSELIRLDAYQGANDVPTADKENANGKGARPTVAKPVSSSQRDYIGAR